MRIPQTSSTDHHAAFGVQARAPRGPDTLRNGSPRLPLMKSNVLYSKTYAVSASIYFICSALNVAVELSLSNSGRNTSSQTDLTALKSRSVSAARGFGPTASLVRDRHVQSYPFFCLF